MQVLHRYRVLGTGKGGRHRVGTIRAIWHGGVGGGLESIKLKRFFGGVSG